MSLAAYADKKLTRIYVDPLLRGLHLKLLPLDDHAAIVQMATRLVPRHTRHGVRRLIAPKKINSLPDNWLAA